jgi:NAD-dependent SIR2 family protein deacetylase
MCVPSPIPLHQIMQLYTDVGCTLNASSASKKVRIPNPCSWPLSTLPSAAARKKKEGKRWKCRMGILCHQIVFTEDSYDPIADEKGLLWSQDASSSLRMFLILGTSLTLSGIQSFVREMTKWMNRPTDLQLASSNQIRDYNYLDLLKLRTSKALVVYVNLESPPSNMVHCIDLWLQEDVEAWSQRITSGMGMRKCVVS